MAKAKANKFGDGTTARQIMDAANEGYPDGHLADYYDAKGNRTKGEGDTMAEYIVIEIESSILDALDDKLNSVDAIDLAIHRLETGQTDVGNVISHLYAMRDRLG